MFNVLDLAVPSRRPVPGFYVDVPDELPGSRVGGDAAVQSAFRAGPGLLPFTYGGISPDFSSNRRGPSGRAVGSGPLAPGLSRWLPEDSDNALAYLATNPYASRSGNISSAPLAADGRDAAWAKCHARCAPRFVGRGYGPETPKLYRRCMRECMAESGYVDY